MKIGFRQGIVRYPEVQGTGQAFLQVTGSPTGSEVNILAGSGQTVVAFAHRTANYLHTETSNVIPAWSNIPTGANAWLYWDLDSKTGVITYGFTTVQPTVGSTQPSTLVNDLHWFDTSINVMKVYDGTRL